MFVKLYWSSDLSDSLVDRVPDRKPVSGTKEDLISQKILEFQKIKKWLLMITSPGNDSDSL